MNRICNLTFLVALSLRLFAQSNPAVIINQTYSGPFPASITGTLPSQGTALEESFTLLSTTNLTVFTSSYANGGFEARLSLYDSMGHYITTGVTPGTSPVGRVDPSTGSALDAYLTAPNLPAGTYIVALTDFLLNQSLTATNLSDGFTVNYGSGTTFVDEMGNPRNGNFALTITTGNSVPHPFGHIDTPVNGAAGQAGAINFTGWALSTSSVAKIALCREPVAGEAGNIIDPHCLISSSPTGLVYMTDAVLVPGVRPDVATSFPGYPNNNWGWGAQILTNYLPGTNRLPLGNGTYKLHAIAADPAGLSTDLGTTTISANNAVSVLPFGTIDTPRQGETISGTNYINFGWVVTPQPNIVPIDGSTITVYIDGHAVGHPTYNQFRSDIATLFPGLKNSNGAVGFFAIDTTRLSNGIHSIEWGAMDSAGHGGGIGSRNFFVQN